MVGNVGQDKRSTRSARSACWSLGLLILAVPGVGLVESATYTDPQIHEKVIATKLNPTQMEIAPDGRVFVNFKNGDVRVIKNDVLLPKPFCSVQAEWHNEQGLIGIAFHPQFADSHYVYIYYTVPDTTGQVRHSRVTRWTADGDTAVAGSEKSIIELDPLSVQTLHVSGAIHFGKDGKLYIAAGNSGIHENSSSLGTVLGKILRLNSDGTVPQDNPFMDKTTGKNQAIYALGLRNPFTTAIQPGTGRMFIGDVQDGGPEVIQDGVAGSNFGYPNYQGGINSGNPYPANSPGTLRLPVSTYPHPSCGAITGSSFYTPTKVHQFPPQYHNLFFFSDYCGGFIHTLDLDNNYAVAEFATGLMNPLDIKFSPVDGSMYYLTKEGGGNDYTTTGKLTKVTYGNQSTEVGQVRAFDHLPQGWRVQMARNGRLAWMGSQRSMEVHGIDGQLLFRANRDGDALSGEDAVMPSSMHDGVYLVRYR